MADQVASAVAHLGSLQGQVHRKIVESLPPWLAENQGDPKNVRYNNSF